MKGIPLLNEAIYHEVITPKEARDTLALKKTAPKAFEKAIETIASKIPEEDPATDLKNGLHKSEMEALDDAVNSGIINTEEADKIRALEYTAEADYNKAMYGVIIKLILQDPKASQSVLDDATEKNLISAEEADEIRALEDTDNNAYKEKIRNLIENDLKECTDDEVAHWESGLEDAVYSEIISTEKAEVIRLLQYIKNGEDYLIDIMGPISGLQVKYG